MFILVEGEIISIVDCLTREVYATHPLCHEKGKLIGQKRKDPDKSRTIKEQEVLLQELFQNDECLNPFLERIHKEKGRYYRDQLGVMRRLFEEWSVEILIKGLHYCTQKELYSAGDLKSVVIYLNQLESDKNIIKLHTALPQKYRGNKPRIRDLKIYEDAMEGECYKWTIY